MSIRHMEEISCPHCGNNIQMLIWDTLNADLDPEARDELLNGRIHAADCPVCKQTVKVRHGFLYHDMGREFFVLYCPYESIKDPNFFKPFSVDGHLNFNTSLPEEEMPKYAKNVHYVFSMGELGRYIEFREKLADIKMPR